MTRRRSHVDDLRGATRLAAEATLGVAEVVQAMQVTIGGGPALLGAPLAGAVRLVTTPVHAGIRAVTSLVASTLDGALAALAPLVGDGAPGPAREAVLAALNGVLGDYLHATGNPLALGLHLHVSEPHGARLLVLVHGLSMSHHQWNRNGHNHGTALAAELGYTPVFVAYNSGRHISDSGEALATALEELVAGWPVPVEEIVLVGFSMGGLVARSAVHAAEQAAQGWRTRVRRMVTLGSPHHGSHLERGGNWAEVMLGISRYSAPIARLGRLRSAGITDLRWGNVIEAHWRDRDRFELGLDPRTPVPLPAGVATLAIAGSASPAGSDALAGDGLVPVASALGRHARPELQLAFDETRVVYATKHLDLLASPDVLAALRAWLD